MGDGHLAGIQPPGSDHAGILAWLRTAQQLVQLHYELRIGQDLSIGYLSHDSEFVQLHIRSACRRKWAA